MPTTGFAKCASFAKTDWTMVGLHLSVVRFCCNLVTGLEVSLVLTGIVAGSLVLTRIVAGSLLIEQN